MIVTLQNGRIINISELVQGKMDTGYKLFCYKAFGIDTSFFTEKDFEVWNILDKIILICNVHDFEYVEKIKVRLDKFGLKNPDFKKAEKGVYLFFIHPCSESSTEVNNEELCAIMQVCLGFNILHHYVFDKYYYPNNGGNITVTKVDLKKYITSNKIEGNRISLMKIISKEVNKLDIITRSRIETSLRWYFKASLEENYVDAFLSYWIAIETLAKEQGTDIKYIVEHLEKIYTNSEMKEHQKFHVNLLFSIRSAIVHNGKFKELSFEVLTYISAIYADILFSICGIKSERRALEFKITSNIDLKKFTVKQSWKSLDHLK